MGRTRNIFIVIVLNIFLTLLVSVMLEYNNLADRFSQLEDNVNLALDMSLDASTASEELFSADYQSHVSSVGVVRNGKKGSGGENFNNAGAVVTVWLDGDEEWGQIGAYSLGMYYEENNKLPSRGGEVPMASSTMAIYEWLFGEVGEDVTNLDWSRMSSTMSQSLVDAYKDYSSGSRKPTDKFFAFYDAIGNKIMAKAIVKHKVPTSEGGYTFTIEEETVPVLDNMGLDFGDPYTTSNTDKIDKTNDNFLMSYHAGSMKNGETTVYYITPYSLGITYVPVEVLKPTFCANLDTIVRLQKLAGGNLQTTDEASVKETLVSAGECVPTSVYVNGGSEYMKHINKSKHRIVNDGNVEYDIDSVQVRVDYFKANFYQKEYSNIAARVEGALSGYKSQSESLAAIGDALKKSDTQTHNLGDNQDGERIVAKVTVRVKVYIPYQSSVLQWLSKKDYESGHSNPKSGIKDDLHFSVKAYNPKSGTVDRTQDGTWYQYSTYIAVTR